MKPSKKLYLSCATLFLIVFSLVSFATEKAVAVFAGGCFWSMQHDFDKLPGVLDTTVGYTGGYVINPTYKEVSTGKTGHFESIKVVYDPSKVSYQQLVDFFWHDIDPSDPTGQFCDHGTEYLSMIFYQNPEQQKIAMDSKTALIHSHQINQVATQIVPAQPFYPAEEYHQKFSEKNPEMYNAYRLGCERDARSVEIWGRAPGK